MNENNQIPVENQQPQENIQGVNTQPTAPQNVNQQSIPQANMAQPPQQSQPQNKKNTTIILIVIIAVLVLALVGLLAKFILGGDKTNNSGNKTPAEEIKNDKDEKPNTPTTPATRDESSISQVVVNGITINFPCTKEVFEKIGWTWNEKYAKIDLAPNYTTNGGRIGEYPGGVVVSVINKTNETKHIEDCTIDDGTFYNPGDGSKTITFVGGIDFSYDIAGVKEKMASLGYKNVKESTIDKGVDLYYYLNDDQNNFKDLIGFNFYDNVLKSVDIRTTG